MGVHVKGFALEAVHGLTGGEHHVQQLVYPHVHLLLADAALVDRLHQLVGAVAAGGGHLQMGAGPNAVHKIVAGAPVGHHEAVEAPGVPKDFLEKLLVFVGVDAVDHVIGGHDGLGMALGDGDLKIGEVDLPQRALVHHGVGGHAAQLRIVGGEVFGAGGYAVFLDAPDVAGGHFARQIRVFAEILKVSAAEGAALDVEAGAQQHAHVLAGGLLPQHLPQGLPQGRVPGVGHGGGGGIAGGGQGAVKAQLVAGALLLADAVGAVGQGDALDAQPLDALGLPEVAARQQVTFFL